MYTKKHTIIPECVIECDTRNENECGINTHKTTNEQAENNILTAVKLYTLDTDVLRSLLGNPEGLVLNSCLRVLVLVYGYPKRTIGQLWKISRTANERTMKRTTLHLCNVGLIKEMGRPRFIEPFKAWKIDKAYVITPKGKNVLIKLLG
jgi:hypothetical protein